MAWLIAAALGVAALAFAFAWRRAERRAPQLVPPPASAPVAADFIGPLAHDFNNLLGIVIGNLDLVATQNQDQRLAEPLKSALDTALRAAAITKRMSAAAGRQVYRTQRIPLDDLLGEWLEALQQEVGERHPIAAELASEAAVQLDPDALIDVVRELLRNAAAAMPDGGTIRLVTQREPSDQVRLSVADRGVGMAPELAQRAFEPFITTQRNARGAGLGLAMVRSFANHSGGEAVLDSVPGQGTTAMLRLPAAADVAAPGRPAEPATVLVVEDSAAMRRLAVTQLEELGYRTLAYETGEAALEALREAPPVDLLFTDLLLPGELDGRALIAAARRLQPGLRVLVSTGGGDTAGLPVLPKPYRKADLARAVAASLAQP